MKKANTIVWHYPHLLLRMGGTMFLLDLFKHLVEKNSILLIANQGDPEVIKEFREIGVDVQMTGGSSTNSLVYWGLLPFFLVYDIWQVLRIAQKNPEAKLVATLFPSNFIMMVVSFLQNKSFSFYCYEPFPFFHNWSFIRSFPFPQSLMTGLLAILYGWLDKLAVRSARTVFTLNEVTARMIKNVYNIDSTITLMGVDSDFFSPKSLSDDYLNDLKLKEFKLVAHSTDYTPFKKTDDAIIIFSKIVNRHPDARLVITSTRPNSPQKNKLVEIVDSLSLSGIVLFLGLIPYCDVPKLYTAATCYLSTSDDEMLGTTSSNLPVKQALSCGTPAIRVAITKEDVENGISGFTYQPGALTEAAENLNWLLEHPKEAKAMGMVGRKRIKKMYDWERVATVIRSNL